MEHLMTSEEVAELLHVDPVTIRRLVNKGELAAYRIGADYRFAPSDVEAYLQRQRISAHAGEEQDTELKTPLDPLGPFVRNVLQGKGRTCIRCGTPCPTYFRYCFNCGQQFTEET